MSGELRHSPAEITRKVLTELSLGTMPEDGQDWPVYYGHFPDQADNAIGVFNSESRVQGRIHFYGDVQEHYGIQVRFRGTNPQVARTRAQAVALAMDRSVLRQQVVLSDPPATYLVQSFARVGGIVDNGIEVATRRRIYTINALAAIEMLT